jgi:hypothetical protein
VEIHPADGCGYHAAKEGQLGERIGYGNEWKNEPRAKVQLKPSKWPLRIRSPIGEGARRGLALSATVAERRGFVVKGVPRAVGLTAVLGGGLGGELGSDCGYRNVRMNSAIVS